MRHIHAPGLGHDPRTPRTMKTYNEAENTTKYTTSDYVVPPKVPQLQMGPGIGKEIKKMITFTYTSVSVVGYRNLR